MGWCECCDPKYYIVYGFCGSCGRRCFPPLYDPKGGESVLDYEEARQNWNSQRSDLVNDMIRQSEGMKEALEYYDMILLSEQFPVMEGRKVKWKVRRKKMQPEGEAAQDD